MVVRGEAEAGAEVRWLEQVLSKGCGWEFGESSGRELVLRYLGGLGCKYEWDA